MKEKFALSEPHFNDLSEDFKRIYKTRTQTISSTAVRYGSTDYTTLCSTHAITGKKYYIIDAPYAEIHRAFMEPIYKKYGIRFYDERLKAGDFDEEIKFYELSQEERVIELERRNKEFERRNKEFEEKYHKQ